LPVDRKQISRAVPAVLAMIAFLAAAVGLISDESPRDWLVNDRLFSDEIRAAALKHKLDPQLVRSVVFQESRFDPFTRGNRGEYGLMQVLPSGSVADWARINRKPVPTAEELTDPVVNLEIGCWYLARAMKRYSEYRNGTVLALAMYNAGIRRSEKWKPPVKNGDVVSRITIKSTRRYVTQIMKRYRRYQEK
jgi:soluble lytic murein transglycosylase